MALDYDTTSHLDELDQVIHDYTAWFMEVTRCVFFPHQPDAEKHLSGPETFMTWKGKAESQGDIDSGVIQNLAALYEDFQKQADTLIKQSVDEKKDVAYDEYDKLATYFEEFLNHLRRVERDCLLEDSGIDLLTGLRREDVLHKDIAREMDRLSRQGKAFVLALVRIDAFEDIESNLPEKESKAIIVQVAELIKKSVRSFDDAYRMSDGMFLLSLKQTGNTGGFKALMRLKAELEEADASYELNGKHTQLSLSSCIVEPLPNDNVDDLLETLMRDLDKYAEREGSVLEYHEVSPLQRFVQDGNE